MSKVLESIHIKGLQLKNRIVMPPIATGQSPDGLVNQEIIDYYAEFAKESGLGLIITEHTYVRKSGKASKGQVGIESDEAIEGFKRLTDRIHEISDTKVFCQINHAGAKTNHEITGSYIVSSGTICMNGMSKPKMLTVGEIEKVKDDFISAAVRVKKAGFDGVEIHSAHGYLLNQFYTPLANNRSDIYDASCIENRVRIHTELVRGLRQVLGADYPIAVRLGACDYTEGGSTIADGAAAARLLESAGADIIDISGGICLFSRTDYTGIGTFYDAAQAIKNNVNIPVILTGNIHTVAQMQELYERGVADMFGIGRALIKDKYVLKE